MAYAIHKRIISGGPSWVQTTWDWVMGQIPGFSSGDTLVNVVGAIWSVGVITISAVKNVANDVWNGIKAAGEFILKAVIGGILDLMVSIVTNVMKSFALALNKVVPNSNLIINSDSLVIDGETYKISRNGFRLYLDFAGFRLDLGDLYGDLTVSYDTLSTQQIFEGVTLFSALSYLLSNLGIVNLAKSKSLGKAWVVVGGGSLIQLITMIGLYYSFDGLSEGSEKESIRDVLVQYYTLSGIFAAFGAALNFGSIRKGDQIKLLNPLKNGGKIFETSVNYSPTVRGGIFALARNLGGIAALASFINGISQLEGLSNNDGLLDVILQLSSVSLSVIGSILGAFEDGIKGNANFHLLAFNAIHAIIYLVFAKVIANV